MRSVTGEASMASAFGQGCSTTSVNNKKVTALKQELETLRKTFENTVQLLKASRRELLAIRQEAIFVADEYEKSNKEIVAINRDLRELLRQSDTFSHNPPAALYVDLRALFLSELSVPRTGPVRFEKVGNSHKITARHENAARRVADLTPRQRQIMVLVVKGQPSKIIAADLHISQRTVENHRAEIMKRTESKSLPALARLALFASTGSAEEILEVA